MGSCSSIYNSTTTSKVICRSLRGDGKATTDWDRPLRSKMANNGLMNNRRKNIRKKKWGNGAYRPPDKPLLSLEYHNLRNLWGTTPFMIYFSLLIIGSTYGPSKIAKPAVFQAVLRGIGKSFQSAITAPRINLTGYGNATAQS